MVLEERKNNDLLEKLLTGSKNPITDKEKKQLVKAFNITKKYYEDNPGSGLEHCVNVAELALDEIGLGVTSAICSLLHGVDLSYYPPENIEKDFGKEIREILEEFHKISDIQTDRISYHSEAFRNLFLSMIDDIRVILIKLAHRINDLRNINSFSDERKEKIINEVKSVYIPIAHRLGLYNIKTELEELSFKYSNPDIYKEIKKNIEQYRPELLRRFNAFKKPLEEQFKKSGRKVEIRLREKSGYSIWRNMKVKEMNFKDIYLTPTVEIIIDSPPESEKYECWSGYATLTNVYKSNIRKLEDLISQPKANGYSAIHTTVISPEGYWVNVQIRSKRMDEIAKKGYTAYFKYEGNNSDKEVGLQKWLNRTKELIWNTDDDAIPFIDAFKTDLFTDDIYIFTPKGDIITLPKGATVLDFAYAIHTDLGYKSIGANVNHKLVSVEHKLQTGDQVEVISSKKQKPSEKQLEFVITTRAKTWIKKAIKAERKKYYEEGEKIFNEICKALKADQKKCDVKAICESLNINDSVDFFYFMATGKIELKDLKELLFPNEKKSIWKNMIPYILPGSFSFSKKNSEKEKKENLLLEGVKSPGKLDYVVATCCNPIPEDDVVSIKKPGGPLEIHKTDCKEAIKLMSQYGKSVSNPNWEKGQNIFFLAGIKVVAKNEKGLIRDITKVISTDFDLNIRKFDLETIGEMVTANILIYVKNLTMLNMVIKKLKKLKPVIKASRMENF